ncbi:MAG: NADP-dependent oxidoreductase [Gammaproteobacteria bacterium]|nr:NADPH:quinone reductase [Chromatiales bacterium]MCP4926863.1 NADP-dependent oxidoreductase [Gammaproteobacteria bacterium]MDP7093807.1 NADP-dependent oxidoreductase [Gammaproteobacteria bacterium]MDP7295902.1 NADP-dependent oxidoreductase [Gammaproteobacteria bacterium]MDP7419930.1 NADP-dependent oxidoreductase [Gammaproteobacteria bacterium]
MRAVYYESHGNPDVLRLGDLPVPKPAPDQVLVQIAAAGVNPIDRRLRDGELQEYITRTFPVVPGWDLAGRIVEVGNEVTAWHVGDEVLGLAFTWSIQHGSYAEYAPIDASALATKPTNLSFIEAAALPLASLTAWQSLAEFGALKRGQTALIQAGAGGLGSAAIPMAKRLGATVYTTARQDNSEYLRGRGADHVIDYTRVDYAAAIREREPEGVDFVLESLLGEGIAEAAIRLVKTGGVVVYMNNEPPEIPDIADRQIKTEFLHHRADGPMLAELVALYRDGQLPLPQIEALPLEAAVDAHRRSESRRTRGKLVLVVQDLD